MGQIAQQGLLIAAKDTKVFFRDRFAVAFSFLFPLMFVLGFSLALANVGPEDEQLTFKVTTLESEGVSHQIIEGLTESEDSGVEVVVYAEALEDVENEELNGFVAFPADFTAALLSGQPTAIEVVTRDDAPEDQAALVGFADSLAGRISNTQVALRAILELRGAGGSGLTEAEVAGLSQSDEPLTIQTDQIGEIKPFKASNFTLTGYLTMFVFFAAAMSAEAILKERQNQTLERLMSSGTRRESVILGKYLMAMYRGLMQLAVLWVVGLLAFRIDLGAAPAAVILVSVLMVLASSGFGIMLATFVRTVASASSAGVLVSLTLAPIGGSWWPLFITPEWMQTLARLTPHGWANTAFNKLMLFGADFGDVWIELAALVLFGVAFLTVGLLRFRLSVAQ